MALLERVATLLRANVNDLLDKAENPPVMLKQLLRDMENQLLQVKTQVAAAIADQHVLESKCAEIEASAANWRRKAELAVIKHDEDLARVAAERYLQAQDTLQGYKQQLADQMTESQWMRDQYRQLQAKLAETEGRGELLLAAHRRTSRRDTPTLAPERSRDILKRMRDDVLTAQATKAANRQTDLELAHDANERLDQLEKRQRVDEMLHELRGKLPLLPGQS